MTKIKQVEAMMVLDSRGNPTVNAGVLLDNGIAATASVPSGASRGTYEAVELRDGDEAYNGMGVSKAIDSIKNTIAPAIVGMDIHSVQEIDKKMIELDGTDTKSNLGANAILAVSIAAVRTAASDANTPLYMYIRNLSADNKPGYDFPTPIFNMLEGGRHADNSLDFQEYLVIPATKKSFEKKIELGVSVHQSLRKLLLEKNMSTLTADEGGFAPELASNLDGLLLLKNAIEHAQYSFALDAFLGVDIAANNITDTSNYKLIDRNTSYKPSELVEFYTDLIADYSLLYIEDPFAEDDIESWKTLHEKVSNNTMIIGDDLTATNPYRFQLALDSNTISGLVIKPNQIGTVTEAIAVSKMAQYKNMSVIVSHRSGETTDDFIADFAIGVGADYVKFGAPARDRIAKYNRLLEIHHETMISEKTEQ